MALRDRAVNALRAVFGVERDERAKADSPSTAAARNLVPSMFSVWGREDIGGLLTVSQSLMDRFADYEAMEEYPDINCVSEGMRVYVMDGACCTPTPIEQVATDDAQPTILAYDVKRKKIVATTALRAKLTGREVEVLSILLSNGSKLRVTAEHKILTVDRGYVDAKDLFVGDKIVSMYGGFAQGSQAVIGALRSGELQVVGNPHPAGQAKVYDITTDTHNFVCEGAVIHNSAFRYFANDATQPAVKDGRTIWTQSRDQALVGIGDDLLHKVLRVEDEIWSQAYGLGMMGNDLLELLITENGVVGTNLLPAPTVRRVERLDGGLIGFVQDITGKFTANGHELRRMLAGQSQIPANLALFEDWQVAHFRMRATRRRSPYGVCIPADGQVWTEQGPKPIIDVQVGERVFCRHAGMLRTTKVIDTVCNGTREIFRLKTAHREIRATANHPFLVRTGGINRWKPLAELKVGDEIVAASSAPGLGNTPALGRRLHVFDDASMIRLTDAGVAALRSAGARSKYGPRDAGLRKVFAKQALSRRQMGDVLEGDSSLSLGAYKAILGDLGLTIAVGDFAIYHGPAATIPTLPDFVDERFCRFFGFMLGDGWLRDQQVCFARGTNEDRNVYYENYLTELGLRPSRTKDNTQVCANSTVLVSLMRDLGWIGGAHNKRIPGWVFTLEERYREALLQGFVDADGWTTQQCNRVCYHTELCNRALVRDIKTLVDGLGLTCGNIRERAPRDGCIKAGTVHSLSGKVQVEDQRFKSGPTYTITWHDKRLCGDEDFALETIKSIESCGEEEVYDIGVADTDHNFLCDGLVVHNSVAEGARWIWKRLVMMEDSVMIYKLSRAPARFVYRIDVTDVPVDKVEGFLRQAKQSLKKKKMVNPSTGRLDMRYAAHAKDEDIFIAVRDGKELAGVDVLAGPDYQCLVGSTRIPLLDGTSKTIKEMADEGGKHWVYSCTTDGEAVPGEARSARISHESADIWEVGLDNCKIVECTWNHPFLTRDGLWVLAKDLKNGSSLMPFRWHKAKLPVPVTPGNCAVAFVRKTGRQEPVYDLTVAGTECFALEAGVFVHNSMDDVEYFKKMLHGTLNVPRDYLGQEGGIPGKSILSNDDVRAARVTLNLQRELRLGWERIIRTHLAARGVRQPWRPEFSVEMTIPSGIWELAAYETMNAAADYASRVQPWTSTRWIQENVLKLSDADIKAIEKEQKKDAEEEQDGDLPSYASTAGGGEGEPPPEGEEAPPEGEEAPQASDAEKPAGEPAPKFGKPAIKKGTAKTPEEQKRYDRSRRLEERRDKESRRRHQEIVDKLGNIMSSDDRRDREFAAREHQRRGFFADLKKIALREQNGRMSALPSGRGPRGR